MGEETSQLLIDRLLMRPRFLISLLIHCKSAAVNLNHHIIEEEDIKKGLLTHSNDLVADIGYELLNIDSSLENVIYAFSGSDSENSLTDVHDALSNYGLDEHSVKTAIQLLIWYGFLGVIHTDGDAKYIYNFGYNMLLMNGIVRKYGDSVRYVINHAFRPALLMDL